MHSNFVSCGTAQLFCFLFFGLIDDHLYSAILCSLEQTHCARLWFYMNDKLFIARFFFISTEVVYLSAGMAGAT